MEHIDATTGPTPEPVMTEVTPPCNGAAPGSTARFQAVLSILHDRHTEAPAEEIKRAPAFGR